MRDKREARTVRQMLVEQGCDLGAFVPAFPFDLDIRDLEWDGPFCGDARVPDTYRCTPVILLGWTPGRAWLLLEPSNTDPWSLVWSVPAVPPAKEG